MVSDSRFAIEDWQHVVSNIDGDGSARQYFILRVSGPRGRWPLKAYIMAPGLQDEGACTPLEEEVDLELVEIAFVELECVLDDPQPGPHLMRIYIDSVPTGEFSFTLSGGPGR